jgi:hypothetical protein
LGNNVLSRFTFAEILEEGGASPKLDLVNISSQSYRKSQEELGRDLRIMFPNEGKK